MTAPAEAPVMLLHGLGETSSAWDRVKKELPGVDWLSPELSSFCGSWSNFTLTEAADELAEQIDTPVDVCGLSLGAVLALELAIRHPEKVRSLFLSAPQVSPPPMMMTIQKALMQVLPQKLVCPPGMSKSELLKVLDVVAGIDNAEAAKQIAVPTTVVVGSKDRANIAAAKQIAKLIPEAEYQEIAGVGHQWSTSHPKDFAAALSAHLARCHAVITSEEPGLD